VKGKSPTLDAARVKILSRLDLPAFGKPIIPTVEARYEKLPLHLLRQE
jgi:hypothetical protein